MGAESDMSTKLGDLLSDLTGTDSPYHRAQKILDELWPGIDSKVAIALAVRLIDKVGATERVCPGCLMDALVDECDILDEVEHVSASMRRGLDDDELADLPAAGRA